MRLRDDTLRLYRQLQAACFLGLFPLLAGCSGIYLHDRKIEAMTQAAKDDFGKISIDQYFTDERNRVANFTSREDAAVLAYMVASRDRQFTRLIRNDVLSTSNVSPAQLLEEFVNGRMLKIIGKQSADEDFLRKLENIPTRLALDRESREANRSFYQRALQGFVEKKDKLDSRPTECNKVPKSPEGLPQRAEADTHYIRLVKACAEIAKADADETSIRGTIAPGDDSALFGAWAQADAARSVIDLRKAEAAKLIKLIEELQKDTSASNTQSEVEKNIKGVRELLQNAHGLAKFAGAKRISEILERV